MLSNKTRNRALWIAKKKLAFSKGKKDIGKREQPESDDFKKVVVGPEAPKRELPDGVPPVAHLLAPPRHLRKNNARLRRTGNWRFLGRFRIFNRGRGQVSWDFLRAYWGGRYFFGEREMSELTKRKNPNPENEPRAYMPISYEYGNALHGKSGATMANRVIRDSIWNSPSLSKLSLVADAWFPRWVLMADDWGCFQADPRIIKGTAYPLRDDVTAKEIDAWAVEYYNAGLIFFWLEGERLWGYFTAFQAQNTYLQKTTLTDKGEQAKVRRRSPEPPKEAVLVYLKERQSITSIYDILLQNTTPYDKILVSVSVSESKEVSVLKDFPAEIQKPAATEEKPERSQNQQTLDREIETARYAYRTVFGKDIKPAQVCLLAFGRNGKKYNCFGSVLTLLAFWKSCEGQGIDDGFTWSLKCAENPQTVARFEKLAFDGGLTV